MAVKSTSSNYGTVTVTIHWISALLIFALLGSGFRAANSIDPSAKAQFLTLHVPLGITILTLTVARIIWWRFADKKPDAVAGSPAWQERSARALHVLFYVVILGMAASGIGMLALSGAGEIIFASGTEPLPNFHDYLPRVPHGIGARVFVILLVLHVGAALYHQFIRKDGLLSRMWFSR